MSEQLTFDEAQARAIEDLYMSESVLARRKRALELVGLGAGNTFVDLGCGPGFLAVEAVDVVGKGGEVHGLDSSENMLTLARIRAEKNGVADAIQFHEGDVLKLPSKGRTFELGGPRVFSFKEIMELMLATIGRRRLLVPWPFAIAKLQAWFLELAPVPLLTRDQLRLLQRDNVVSAGALTLADLGIEATTAEAILPTYLHVYRPSGEPAPHSI